MLLCLELLLCAHAALWTQNMQTQIYSSVYCTHARNLKLLIDDVRGRADVE